MPPLKASFASTLHATYTVNSQDAIGVLCHRKIAGAEQYLLQWRPEPDFPELSDAACSWHGLTELYRCLHLVQKYIEERQSTLDLSNVDSTFTLDANRKRKSPGADPLGARDLQHGLLTPGTDRSKSPSVGSLKIADDVGPDAYNTVLYKKEGFIIAKKPDDWRKRADIAKVNCETLPTAHMQAVAARTSISQAESAIRHKFLHMLRRVKGVQLENLIDTSTPSLDFTFIDRYVLRNGIYAQPPEIYEGCVKKCKPDMGQRIGCEYTAWCDCLEYAAVDEERLKAKDPIIYQRFKEANEAGDPIDTIGLPKRFPYTRPSKIDPTKPQTLQAFYRDSRNAIYECNDNCRCGPICKSRVVQKGRRVPLTIFKTRNRGWGVYCNEDLIQGEFIDVYLGEVITEDEANKREEKIGKAKDSYLYSLDKFVGQPYEGGILTEEMCYIVDGQFMGNATRFINHSCEPNCRQFTVSYNKNDNRLFNLAFFASEDISAGEELTFDYQDQNEVEEKEAIKKREEAESDPKNADRIKCNCGAPKCRGFLW